MKHFLRVLSSQFSVLRKTQVINWELRTENRELLLSFPCHNQRRNHNVRNRQGQQELPPERHELVISKAGQGPTHPDVQKHKKENLQAEPEHWHHRLQYG